MSWWCGSTFEVDISSVVTVQKQTKVTRQKCWVRAQQQMETIYQECFCATLIRINWISTMPLLKLFCNSYSFLWNLHKIKICKGLHLDARQSNVQSGLAHPWGQWRWSPQVLDWWGCSPLPATHLQCSSLSSHSLDWKRGRQSRSVGESGGLKHWRLSSLLCFCLVLALPFPIQRGAENGTSSGKGKQHLGCCLKCKEDLG